MSEQASLETETITTNPPRWWWLVAGLLLLLLIWLVVALSGSRPLKPLQEEDAPLNITINGQPLLVDFDALNDNPADYTNKRIQVSGNYLRLETEDCELFNGPRIQWGLVAEGLQLNARGFEAIMLNIVSPGTPMTLQGIWRRYPGPAGCGKEPPTGLWYLEVEQIVQPNPLVAGTRTPVAVLSITPPPFPTITLTPIASPPVGTPIPSVTIVSTVVVGTPSSTPTFDGTAVTPTPTSTATSTATGTLATPTSGPGTPTGAPGTPTSTATPTPSVTPGGPGVPTPTNPALITATPGGYPGPTSPAPSPSPPSYP